MALKPACIARIFVGAGRPTERGGRFRGYSTAIDSRAHHATIEEVVRRYFPKGSTHFQSRGTFRERGGRTISEPSVVVEVWRVGPSPAECAEHMRRAELVAAELRKTFGQESVAVVATDPEGRNLIDFVERGPRKSRFGAK